MGVKRQLLGSKQAGASHGHPVKNGYHFGYNRLPDWQNRYLVGPRAPWRRWAGNQNMVTAGVSTCNRLPKKLPIMHPAFLWNAQTMVLPFSTDNHFHSLNEIDYEQNTQKNTIAMSAKTDYNNVYMRQLLNVSDYQYIWRRHHGASRIYR